MKQPNVIFISGITGSLGTAVTKELLKRFKHIKILGYSRCEHRQKQFLKDRRVVLTLGDVRDRERVLEATRGADIIFHFAALKHVDTLEENPEESFKTNVLGTDNILHAQRIHGIERVVFSSTDKSVEPVNAYGASKMLANKLVLRNPNNVVTLYGNVIASNGSVIPLFVKSLLKEKTVYITSELMTRFLIRLEDAAKFVVDCGLGKTGGLKIPEMKGCKVTDIADAVSEILGVKSYKKKFIGIRPGEKLSEWLVSKHDGAEVNSDNCGRFTRSELVELIRPSVEALL